MNWKSQIKKIIPLFFLDIYHYLLSLLGALLYGFPSLKLTVIGVTGTSGKSTVVELIARILQENGLNVASLSSIKFKIKEKEWENKLKMTMPGRFKIQKFLRQAVKAGCKYAVLEVTSEGIKQYRHKFIKFDVAVFTNLTPEHIESHGSFEKYREAKADLFKKTKKVHIINLDDKNALYFWEIPAEKKIGYKIKEAESLLKNLKLFGDFNLYNALAAVHVCLFLGVSLDNCKRVLEKVEGIPGRMEIVIKEPFKVVVDYAHTPDALEKVYKTIQGSDYFFPTSEKQKNLICVLGACGGGRDKWKRPVLGKIAAKYCQEVIVTNEDPYDENPLEIIEQVVENIKEKARKILDRREAIREALKLANNSSVVVITGKGCEPWICLANGKKIPWDDRQVVKEEYEKIRNIRS